ncbi:WLM-domain-containing protein [Cryphonectria parasitica EP155]|uniref:WLM-domain-containing protein n=1 Tax=Cryphonectria parasitica (strain ATCC 38755 / EP155) TaxID=660469 RepID=A0A9P4Y2G8_CRYP1|nr:WLM-domain-containing protein [Cryphonectria parasitica EP155]KAF3765433.1 WLM-domain-containing protein [Cryphonectria parasitica EP155]
MDDNTTKEGEIPPALSIHISKGGKTIDVQLPGDALLSDLITACEESAAWGPSPGAEAPADHDTSSQPPQHFDWDKAKFIAKGAMLRSGPDDNKTIAHLDGKKVTLQVPTLEDLQGLRESSAAARARQDRREAQRRAAVPARRTVGQKRRQEDSEYTFLRIEPLPGLRNPERSRELLVRLAEDPGIKAAMRKHKFTVGLLTEMDPLSNTQSSHEGTTRLLGLNRNHGEAIELRLRTDAYDGYRAYRTIRDTLCHELAHNVHGPHDRNFWDLCHQIEREVAAADWRHGGQSVGGGAGQEGFFYEPSAEADVPDHGGWTGGTYVLGASSSSSASGGGGGATSGGGGSSGGGLSRRDVIARAAEERMRRMQEDSKPPDENGEGGSRTSR